MTFYIHPSIHVRAARCGLASLTIFFALCHLQVRDQSLREIAAFAVKKNNNCVLSYPETIAAVVLSFSATAHSIVSLLLHGYYICCRED